MNKIVNKTLSPPGYSLLALLDTLMIHICKQPPSRGYKWKQSATHPRGIKIFAYISRFYFS